MRVGDLEQVIDQYNADPSRELFQVFMQKTQKAGQGAGLADGARGGQARYDGQHSHTPTP